jgi:guanine deaminase
MVKEKPEERFMRLALRKAREGVRKGQTPFGASIVRGDAVVAAAHNTVWSSGDPTAHAEVNAIRRAARRLKTIDLSGCVLYSTCEPCPMCFAAIHWARLDAVVFGARIADARRLGFNELAVPDRTLKRLAKSPVGLVEDFLREECLDLFRAWAASPGKRAY